MTLYDEISNNNKLTILLFFLYSLFYGIVIFAFLLIIGIQPSLSIFLITFFVLLIVSCFFVFNAGSKIVLSVTGAKKLEKNEFPYVWHSIEALSIGAGVPKPEVYVIESNALNAFATGSDPKHSYIVLTTGIIKEMNRLELEGVMAHELSHIKNYDIRTMLAAAVMGMVIALLADIGIRSLWYGGRREKRGGGILTLAALIFLMLAPFVSLLIKLAISRNREYAADASAAMLTRYPDGLANALDKMKSKYEKNPKDMIMPGINDATRHLFIFDTGKSLTGLFSTHPPIDQRIKRLREL